MKKLLFIGIIFLLIGCDSPTFTSDPSLKESERIAVLEKAKTDTTTILIKMDDKLYIVEKGIIKGYALNEEPTIISTFITGLLIGLIFGIIIVATAKD